MALGYHSSARGVIGFLLRLTGNDGNTRVGVVPAMTLVDQDGNAQGGSGAASNQVQGNTAAGTTDVGNPVKVGGRYTLNDVTLTDGQRGDVQLTAKGAVKVNVQTTDGYSLLTANYVGNDSVAGFGSVLKVYGPSMVANGASLFVAAGDALAAYSQGNVANGVADTGNPVKVGGKYTDGAFGVAASGQRVNLRLDETGNARALLVGPTSTTGALDSIGATTYAAGNPNGSPIPATMAAGSHIYDLAANQWRPQKGDINGTFTVGNAAAGTTDSGSPVKVGGVFRSATPAYTDGQRGDAQITSNGSLYVDFARAANQRSPTTDANTASTGLNTYSQNVVFNGTTWDRQRGNTVGTFISSLQNFAETATPLAAAGTITGVTRAVGTESRFSFFVADAFADQAGTLFLERSTNGTTWIPANGTAGQALAAGQSLQVKLPLTTANYRARYVNGATAQATFLLTTALSLN